MIDSFLCDVYVLHEHDYLLLGIDAKEKPPDIPLRRSTRVCDLLTVECPVQHSDGYQSYQTLAT